MECVGPVKKRISLLHRLRTGLVAVDLQALLTGNRPDITPAQVGALVVMVVGQLIAWGWVSNDNAQWVISIGTFVLAIAWKAVDAYLRGKRNEAAVALPVVGLQSGAVQYSQPTTTASESRSSRQSTKK